MNPIKRTDVVLDWQTFDILLVNETEVDLSDILGLEGRFVYVIESPNSAAIRYALSVSNVCYIGRQGDRNSGNRVKTHATWMSRYLVFSQSNERFRVHICHPRRKNNREVYKIIEGALLDQFKEKFGSFPIFNKKAESFYGNFDIDINSDLFEKNRRRKFLVDFRDGRRSKIIVE